MGNEGKDPRGAVLLSPRSNLENVAQRLTHIRPLCNPLVVPLQYSLKRAPTPASRGTLGVGRRVMTIELSDGVRIWSCQEFKSRAELGL